MALMFIIIPVNNNKFNNTMSGCSHKLNAEIQITISALHYFHLQHTV